MSLEQLFAGSSAAIRAMVQQQRRTADQLGLPFGNRTMTYNSRLAQETGLWAEENGRGKPFHKAAFLAYFKDGRNLALPDVLLKLATASGLPARDAAEIIRTRKYAEAVENDWQKSRSLGITAVPTILFAGQRLTGYQSYERFEHFLRSAGAMKIK